MRGILRAGCLLAIAVLCTGCYKITYENTGTMRFQPDYKQWHHQALYGLIEVSPAVPLDRICPYGFAAVHNEVTCVNGLVWYLCSPYYTPNTVTVTCRIGTSFRLELDQEGSATSIMRLPSP